MKGFLIGVIFTVLLLVLGAYASIVNGWIPANADGQPGFLETWAAHKSLNATLQREAPVGLVPVALTDANIIAGIKLYAFNCAVCHGAADARASYIAVGLFQHAPQLAGDGVEDDPEGMIYWKIKHGIRLTGMPAFGGTLNDKQVWQITLFLKHMDALSPVAVKAWKSVPSVASHSS